MGIDKKIIRANTQRKSKGSFSRPPGAGNFDNQDDFNIVHAINVKYGTLQTVLPRTDAIVNRAYVDLKADGIDPDHLHSKLVASDGSPDPAVSVDALGKVTINGETLLLDSVTIQAGVPKLIFDDTHMGHDKYIIEVEDDKLCFGAGSPIVSFLCLDFNDESMTLSKSSGAGIKIDTDTPTYGFADLLGDQFSKNTGATKPTLAAYNGAINCWQFSAGDEAFMSYHIPHDYVKGTPIFLHIHWSHISTLVTGGSVTFKATSIYSKGHNQAAFGNPVVGTFTGTASTTQYQQIISEVLYSDGTPTGIELDTDLLEPDGVIEMTFELDANNITVSGGGVPDPFIHFVDIHYQTTGLIGTKSKAPDFYT